MSRIIAITIAVFTCTSLALAITIHVPGQYPTIQAGIIAAQDGDTVLVASGTYYELIDFLGKEIVVKSESGPEATIIDGGQLGCVVTFNSGEGSGAVLEEFTVTNGESAAMTASGVYCGPGTGPVIRGNIISNNGYWWSYMGGIGACGASPLIEQNRILANEDAYYGAGIYLQDCSNTVITGNEIASNYTWSGYGVAKGGGIYGTYSEALIERNLIYINTADPPYGAGGGGIALEDSGSYQVYNNTLAYNESIMSGSGTGGGIHVAGFFGPSPNADVRNNIIVYNHGGGVHYAPVGPGQLLLDFNDVWGNDHFDYFGCLPGPFDISLDPQFVGGSPFSYELIQTSPCIDAGAFVTDPDPDGTRADMGAFYFNQEGVNVALVPDRWPIVIPAAGGSFSYTIHLTNHTAGVTEFDIWVDVRLPDSTVFGPIILREGLTFDPNQHAERDLTQAVPGGAPEGGYLYMAHTGDYSTGAIYHETLMPFTKEGTEGFSGHWAISPDLGEWSDGFRAETSQPQSISLSASPNPFNPITKIYYHLPEDSYVSLRVCDLQGRLVEILANGWHPAGDHQLTFDASNLTSGIYLYHMTAGELFSTGKLILVK